jgi:hypothetical protein
MFVIESPILYLGVGNIIAALLSWKRNRDVIWAIIAFFFGWLYCIYWVMSDGF